MKKISLAAKTRKEVGKKLNLLRQENKIPAILYGHNIKSYPLFVDNFAFSKIFKLAGESSIIELLIDDKEKKNVLIKDIQKDPRTDKFLHIDFYQVKLTERIKANVPLVFFGEAQAVKEKGGVLVKNIDEIEVEALPSDLPKEIRVDISSLKDFSDVIRIKDLDISAAVEVLTKQEEIIATTTPPRSEEELEKLKEKVEEKVEEIEGVKKEKGAAQAPEATETEAAAKPEKKEEKKEK
ncbi:MAG: 50S ribosomal protein L25 [Patescibacteria group bacterium]